MQRLGLPFVVGALDKEMVAMAAARGWPHIDVAAAAHGAPEFFRANFTAFRSMGATEVGGWGRGWGRGGGAGARGAV